MDRNTQRLVARTAAKEALRDLYPCFVGVGSLEFRRKLITRVRDRLHEACRMFENAEPDELDEEFYLPLFDALSFITVGTGIKPIRKKPIENARAALELLV